MKIKKILTPLLLILLLASMVVFGAPQPVGPYFDDTYLEYGNDGLNVKTATVTNGDNTHVPTSDNVYDFCETTQDYAQATDKLSFFAATTSAELAGVISDEEGTGKLVYNDSPTFTTQITTPKVVFGDGQGIYDANGNEQLLFEQTASAVNYLKITNSATGNDVILEVVGEDSNIDLQLATKGTGQLIFGNASSNPITRYFCNSYYTIRGDTSADLRFDFYKTAGGWQTLLTFSAGDNLIGFNTVSPSGDVDFNAFTDDDFHILLSEGDVTKWDIYNDHTTDALEVYAGATRRYSFGADGTAIADVAWNTFSPKITATGRDLLAVALEDANKPVKPYEGIPVKKSDDELFDIVPTEYQEEVPKLDEEGNQLTNPFGKPLFETVTKIKDVKVFRERRPNEFTTEEEVQAEFDKYAKCPAKIAIASAKYLEYLTGVIDTMQAKIDELEARIELLEQKETMK